jgi:hypothetical protein
VWFQYLSLWSCGAVSGTDDVIINAKVNLNVAAREQKTFINNQKTI